VARRASCARPRGACTCTSGRTEPGRYRGVVTHGGFVDCHSHAVPSGDDGAQNLDEAVWLANHAGEHGTRILFTTPHVWPALTLTEDRERLVRARFAELRRRSPLELRLRPQP